MAHKYSIGDFVTIKRCTVQQEKRSKYIGGTYEVSGILAGCYFLSECGNHNNELRDNDGGFFLWLEEWLEPAGSEIIISETDIENLLEIK